ncbi:MAG: ABC transporter substrate-binding protein [Cardiobacteriaceae bacterium]|nr:ABC transporter substrate-binding protein [Cardiobacteriaceae bacterium]
MKKTLLLLTALACTTAHSAERIVSAAGYASEIVALLGKGEQLAGVDTTSLLPADLMETKPKIGYRRQLSGEGILSLNPDLILLPPDAAPENAVRQIEGSGITILRLQDPQTLEGIREEIAAIGRAIAAENAAQALIARLEADEAALQQLKSQSGTASALVLLNSGNRGVFALGQNSAGAHLLSILGLENAVDFDGNKPLSLEAFAASPADLILLAARDDASSAPVIARIDDKHPQHESIAHTRAGQNGCAFAVNIVAALGFGANTARDATEILRALEPCLQKP